MRDYVFGIWHHAIVRTEKSYLTQLHVPFSFDLNTWDHVDKRLEGGHLRVESSKNVSLVAVSKARLMKRTDQHAKRSGNG